MNIPQLAMRAAHHEVRWTQSVATLMDVYDYFVRREYPIAKTILLQRDGDKVFCLWEEKGIIAEIYPITGTRTWMFRAWRTTTTDISTLRLSLAVTQADASTLEPTVERVFSATDDKQFMRDFPTYDGGYRDDAGSSVLTVINHLMESVYTDYMTSRIEATNLKFYKVFRDKDIFAPPALVEGEWNGYFFWGVIGDASPYLLLAKSSTDCHAGRRLWNAHLTLKPEQQAKPAWGIGIGKVLTPEEPEYGVLSALPDDFSGKDLGPEQFAALFAACARRMKRYNGGYPDGYEPDFPETDPDFSVRVI